ncbi:odorant receptor Or1 [Pieris rapae]|uniref:odorant receptor Or1 n=1 Tax=Pieris rapae TaxID=64459 RepID=UPI001E279E5A|nr:odorant receptor Or1 [Pieris rapae]
MKTKGNHELSEDYIRYLTQNRRTTMEVSIKNWVKKTGLWFGPLGDSTNWFAKICIICFFITNAAQFVSLIISRNDPEHLFRCFSVLSFCGMGFIKLTSLQLRRQSWRYLYNKTYILENEQLNNDDTTVNYESDDEENRTFPQHILLYTKQFVTTSSWLAKMYSFTAVVYILSPFIEYAIYSANGDVTFRVHVLPIWSPLDNVSIIGYVFTLIVEIIASIYCVAIHITFDTFATGTMIIICGQFTSLREYSKYVCGSGKQCDLNLKRDARAHYRIKKCHFIHVTLLSMVNKLNELIRDIIGIYFFVATLTLCSVAVQLQSTELSATQLISLLQYMCATLTQLLLYCHYGHAVQTESAVFIGDGPFTSSWWSVSGKVRREIAILCTGMSHSCRLFAGPFNVLDLHSFIQIVKTAYSYYTVLRQTSELDK